MAGVRAWKRLVGRLRGGDASAAQFSGAIDRAASTAVLVLAVASVMLAGAVGLGSERFWPMTVTGALVALVGAALVAAGRGHAGVLALALGIGAVLVWCAYLPRDPGVSAPTAERAGMSLDAVDARIARALSGQGVSAVALASAAFGPFDAGASDLGCDAAPVRAGLDALRDGLRLAAVHGQRSLLMIVGAADRRPLAGRLLRRYGSNDGLAAARVERVLGCLALPPGNAASALPTVLRLSAGPVYTPDAMAQAKVAEAAMALDRRVVALVLGVPGATAAAGPTSSPGATGGPNPPRVPLAEDAPTTSSLDLVLIIALALLLVLAALLARLPLPPPRAAPAAKAQPWAVSNELVEAAISHVRDLHQMFAELRTKNFNFFIVIIGASITGVASVSRKAGSQGTMIPFVISC
ncbi:MAG TPA: hypothetical protein VH041_13015, partial [Caldimonas sp.]|nr:hypothetical protein [Caldimonas sp.]